VVVKIQVRSVPNRKIDCTTVNYNGHSNCQTKKGLFQNVCSLKRIWMKSMLDLNIMFKNPSD